MNALGRIRKCRQQVQPLREMADCLQMRGTTACPLPCLQPEWNSLTDKAGLGVMTSEHFRLSLLYVRKAFRQGLRDMLMILLAGAF